MSDPLSFELDPVDPSRLLNRRVRQIALILSGLLGLVETYVLLVAITIRESFDGASTLVVLALPGAMALVAWWAARTVFVEGPAIIRLTAAGLRFEYLRKESETVGWDSKGVRLRLVDLFTPWSKGRAGVWHHLYFLQFRHWTVAIPEDLYRELEQASTSGGLDRAVRVREDSDGRRTEVEISRSFPTLR